MPRQTPAFRRFLAGASLLALSACVSGGVDMDLRKFSKLGFDTSSAAAGASANRPAPDARGVISYPTYQVAVAQSGETVASMAQRLGVNAGELARKNALSPETRLSKGEVVVLPAAAASVPSAVAAESIDITTLAGSAIDRAEPSAVTPITPKTSPNDPAQHRVARGETAYSIARYYNVNVRALADWNGLSQDLSVREGQLLIIPTASGKTKTAEQTSEPGEGSATPTPPSATKALPEEKPLSASAAAKTNAAPDLSAGVSKAASTGRMQMPVSGAIIRPYVKKKNDGIDIAASAGAAVKAADAGTVAAITKDTEQVPILVLRHADGLLTVYANLEGITVAKGASVAKGQTIAKVRAADPAFVHFEVRKGFESVDPMPYLQ